MGRDEMVSSGERRYIMMMYDIAGVGNDLFCRRQVVGAGGQSAKRVRQMGLASSLVALGTVGSMNRLGGCCLIGRMFMWRLVTKLATFSDQVHCKWDGSAWSAVGGGVQYIRVADLCQ